MQDEGDPAPSGEAARDQVGRCKVSWTVLDISFQTAEFHLSITSAALGKRGPVITAWPRHRRALSDQQSDPVDQGWPSSLLISGKLCAC